MLSLLQSLLLLRLLLHPLRQVYTPLRRLLPDILRLIQLRIPRPDIRLLFVFFPANLFGLAHPFLGRELWVLPNIVYSEPIFDFEGAHPRVVENFYQRNSIGRLPLQQFIHQVLVVWRAL